MATKPPMGEEERAALMKKMDDDLEAFMEEMAAKQKSEKKERKPFDFDEFCRDIDQHPAFMTDLGKAENGEYSEHIQALQALKYDTGETEEEKVETAEGHKNEGNKHFKLKKYRWATEAYTNGIKVMCADRKLNSILYQNRAASQARLGNNRSAIRDCATARKFDPQNLKAVIRGTECLLELGYAGDTLKWIDASLKGYDVIDDGEPLLKAVGDLRDKAVREEEKEERDRRKLRAEMAKDLVAKKRLLSAIEERGLNLLPRLPLKAPELFEWSLIEVNMPQLKDHQRVSFTESGSLQWPLLIQYPEVGQTDVMTECDEHTMVGTLLTEVLSSPAEWDPEHKYKMDAVSFFVSDQFDEYLMEVYPWTDFRTAFSYPGYQIKQGLPVLMVFTNEKRDKSFTQLDGNKFTVA
ncbi:ttc-4 [Pristionchus pacificus]|uniref:Tetratricopeptide repeat-containing protein n=1 Tax=Pristionchus pacificus TaxID=54126 RepID=A0A2A6B9H6_PRIPA|nr:ttc-4 [Pristionchus pacificus]|eukprot:PDM62513.1 Tetratricopeptide repeat-containing protein [Pristionchus pacificus]